MKPASSSLSTRWLLILLTVWLSACSVGGTVQAPPSATARESLPSATLTPSQTATPEPTQTLTATPTLIPTATVTPQPLTLFKSRLLRPGVVGQDYIHSTCDYLALRWGVGKADPDTVVVPIMYHSVIKAGRTPVDNVSIEAGYFQSTLAHARDLGFQTITTEQLIGFLTQNEPIPPRSLLLIIDDRRMGVVRSHFLPVLEDYGWTVTMAYITGVMNTREWQDLESLYATGRVDVQVHGFMHNGTTYFTDQTSTEIIHQEIEKAIPLIEQHLGYQPHAFIWPGGNFLSEAVNVARQAGYQVAFTAFSRGPLLFNWIPLGEPEIAMKDPLMVLPRYWSTAAYINLDEAVRISNEAHQFAQDHRQEEQDWYNSYCSSGPPLQPIPIPTDAPLEPGDIAP